MEKKLKIKKSTKIFLFDLLIWILLYLTQIDFSNAKVLQDDFMITFCISIIGIFLAIITLMYGLIDNIIN